MKNAFRKLALVGASAAAILGLARPAAAALTIRDAQRLTWLTTIIEQGSGTASGTRSIATTNLGLFEGCMATNTTLALTHTTANARHVSDFRTNEHSIHLTWDARVECSHSDASFSNGVTRVSASSEFSSSFILSADTAFSYTLIPYRNACLTNEEATVPSEAQFYFERLNAAPYDAIAVVAYTMPYGLVLETNRSPNGTLTLSGVAPAGDYWLVCEIDTGFEDEDIDKHGPVPASAGVVSVSGFEFRATTLPPPNTPPRLEASLVGGNVILSWSMAYNAFDLEEAQAVDGTTWSPVAATRTLVDDRLVVTVETTSPSRFYRLKGRL